MIFKLTIVVKYVKYVLLNIFMQISALYTVELILLHSIKNMGFKLHEFDFFVEIINYKLQQSTSWCGNPLVTITTTTPKTLQKR